MELTYDVLAEVFRLEKSRVELQVLDPEFYSFVTVYLDNKALQATSDEARRELLNAVSLVRKIYFCRCRKIWVGVIDHAKAGGLFNTAPLLPLEKEIYDKLLPVSDSAALYLYNEILPRKIKIAEGTQ